VQAQVLILVLVPAWVHVEPIDPSRSQQLHPHLHLHIRMMVLPLKLQIHPDSFTALAGAKKKKKATSGAVTMRCLLCGMLDGQEVHRMAVHLCHWLHHHHYLLLCYIPDDSHALTVSLPCCMPSSGQGRRRRRLQVPSGLVWLHR